MAVSLLPLRPGTADFAQLEAALTNADLPTEDLHADGAVYFTLHGAFAGLVDLGEDALIRSVTVRAAERGRGLGRAVVEAMADKARDGGARRLWLLTTDAADYFGGLGWRPISRDAAPERVRTSRQFSQTCPDSAVLMCRSL